MVRMQLRMEVRYGQFGEFMTRLESVNEVVRARGWVEHVAWAPMSGNVNEVVMVADYADLRSYESEELALHSDAEFMARWRSLAELLAGNGPHRVVRTSSRARVARATRA